MSVPRDHHFIPAFYLSQWTGLDDKLVEYTKKRGKLIPKPVGPRSTGYETDLYRFPDLPSASAQYLEQVFFNYADDVASRAYKIHLGSGEDWNSELLSAWSRFVIGIHLRHPDAIPELRTAAQALWSASSAESQVEYEKLRKPEDPELFDDYLGMIDPYPWRHRPRLTSLKAAMWSSCWRHTLITPRNPSGFLGTLSGAWR
jgi:Protein of unknown function (DUF4238)